MLYDAFYQEIQKMLEEIYLKAGSMQLEQKEFFREADQKIEENRTFIEEQTADWSAEDWKNLFFYYVENGNPEVDDFVGRKLNETCGPEFLRGCIRSHIGLLENDIYSSGSTEALHGSDLLLAAVKLLNRMGEGGSNQEVMEAFSACSSINEHILYELAEYLCRECGEQVCTLIADDSLEDDKLIALASAFASQGRRDDAMFRAMKQRFKRLPDESEVKALFAAVFGDYGEPNAILPIRKYMKNLIELYREKKDREIFSKIMMASSVVEGLGGSAQDLLP